MEKESEVNAFSIQIEPDKSIELKYFSDEIVFNEFQSKEKINKLNNKIKASYLGLDCLTEYEDLYKIYSANITEEEIKEYYKFLIFTKLLNTRIIEFVGKQIDIVVLLALNELIFNYDKERIKYYDKLKYYSKIFLLKSYMFHKIFDFNSWKNKITNLIKENNLLKKILEIRKITNTIVQERRKKREASECQFISEQLNIYQIKEGLKKRLKGKFSISKICSGDPRCATLQNKEDKNFYRIIKNKLNKGSSNYKKQFKSPFVPINKSRYLVLTPQNKSVITIQDFYMISYLNKLGITQNALFGVMSISNHKLILFFPLILIPKDDFNKKIFDSYRYYLNKMIKPVEEGKIYTFNDLLIHSDYKWAEPLSNVNNTHVKIYDFSETWKANFKNLISTGQRNNLNKKYFCDFIPYLSYFGYSILPLINSDIPNLSDSSNFDDSNQIKSNILFDHFLDNIEKTLLFGYLIGKYIFKFDYLSRI